MSNPYRTVRRVGRIVGRVIGWTLFGLYVLFVLFLVVLATISTRGVALLPFAVAGLLIGLVLLCIRPCQKLAGWWRQREDRWDAHDTKENDDD